MWWSESLMAKVRRLEAKVQSLEQRANQIERRVTTIERGGFGVTPKKLDGLSTDPDKSVRKTSSSS